MKNAEPFLPQTFLVLNGDSFIAIDCQDLAAFHKRENASVTLALASVQGTRFGRVVLEDKLVRSFIEKGKLPRSTLANAGVYVMEKHVLKRVSRRDNCSI